MNKDKNNLLTKTEITFLIIGFALGPGFLRLPNSLIIKAAQDSWISAMLALIYPICMLIIANYIISKHPKENLLLLNKKYFGYIFGIIFNYIFLFQFMYYTCSIILDFSTVARIYILAFLTPTKIILVTTLLCVYTCSKGIKVVSQISVIVSYMLILLILLSFSALNYGSFDNLQPILDSSFKNILFSALEAAYFYTGFEFLLLYHPLAKDVKDIKKASIAATIIAGSIWIWTVFITIFYLGVDIIPKSFYSFILVFESIHIPIVNNFRYVAMFIWSLISFRIISNFYLSLSFILNDLTSIPVKKLNLLLFPIVFFLCTNVIQSILTKEQLMLLSKIFVVFNIIFLSILSLLVWIKPKPKI